MPDTRPVKKERKQSCIYIVGEINRPYIAAYNNARRAILKLQELGSEKKFMWEDRHLRSVVMNDDVDAATRFLRHGKSWLRHVEQGTWVHCGSHRVTRIPLY